MSFLSISELAKDNLVQSVVAILSADGTDMPGLSDLQGNEVLQLLETVNALDSRTGAIVIAEEMLRHKHGADADALIAQLPPSVGPIVTLLKSDFTQSSDGVLALLAANDVAAVKLAASAMALSGTGEGFENAKQWADAGELARMGREMTDLSLDIIESGVQSQLFRSVEPGLVEKFVESVTAMADLAGGQTRRKMVDAALASLASEMAAGGVYLAPAVAAIAPATVAEAEPGIVLSLARDEIMGDAIVQKTLKGVGAESLRDSDIDQLDTLPILQLLIDTDSLDSVSAAVLLADEITRGHSARDLSKQIPTAVADVINTLHADEVAFGGPAALLESKNPAVQKIAFAAITAGISGEAFRQGMAEADARERKLVVGEMANAGIQLIEQLTETDGWKHLAPKLLDRFTDAMTDLADLSETRTQKRLIQTAIQMLKEDIAGVTADEITQPKPGLPQNLPPAPKLKRGPGGLNV